MRFLLTFLLWATLSGIFAQGEYDIDIKVNNYDNDTLIVGYYFAEKQLVRDTLLAEQPGNFRLSGKDTLRNGVYLLLTRPDNEYIQFHVNEGNTAFSLEFDFEDKSKVTFKNSEDNETFQAYLQLIAEHRPEAVELRDTIKALKESGGDTAEYESRMAEIDDLILSEQQRIIAAHPDYLTAIILKASEEIDVPDFEGDEKRELKRYLYYKDHYFDNIGLANPLMLYSGALAPKVDYYMEKLTPNHPDSIKKSIDYLLEEMKPASETRKYYLSTFLNKYAKSKVIGFDAIYVHLVDKYYNRDETPWVSEENLAKIKDNANKLRPVLLGKEGADLTVYDKSGKEITISELDYEYLVLLFWAPDCGHCTKMMPGFVEFNEKWSAQGIKTLAVCTKLQDKTETCWEKLEEKEMMGFINGADQYFKSRFRLKYNVTTTPKVFILDKDRQILMKNIGSDQLESVMIEILKRENREDLIPQ